LLGWFLSAQKKSMAGVGNSKLDLCGSAESNVFFSISWENYNIWSSIIVFLHHPFPLQHCRRVRLVAEYGNKKLSFFLCLDL
jgi:hypothetical protein